jgi:antitoxin (DNA-binding transcriptional repressor) of toxin-antitoxin stability system
MTEVGLETLQAELSSYLTRASQGERIVIIEQGQSIATLVGFEGTGVAKRAWELVETGVASWRGGKPSGSRQRPRPRGMSASATVLKDRR